jgi:hypothetical protein
MKECDKTKSHISIRYLRQELGCSATGINMEIIVVYFKIPYVLSRGRTERYRNCLARVGAAMRARLWKFDPGDFKRRSKHHKWLDD